MNSNRGSMRIRGSCFGVLLKQFEKRPVSSKSSERYVTVERVKLQVGQLLGQRAERAKST